MPHDAQTYATTIDATWDNPAETAAKEAASTAAARAKYDSAELAIDTEYKNATGMSVGPVLSTLSPTSKVNNSGQFTLTVNGTGFDPGATVRWKGAVRATTFVSVTQLTAVILAGDITAAGAAAVTVANGAGALSNSVNFTVT